MKLLNTAIIILFFSIGLIGFSPNSAEAACPPDANELCETAEYVSSGFELADCVDFITNPLDWYYFDCPDGLTNVTINMEVFSGDADLYLLGYDCDDLYVLDYSANWDLEPEYISYGPAGNGPFYIVVEHWEGAPSDQSDYHITIEYNCGSGGGDCDPEGNETCVTSTLVSDGFSTTNCVELINDYQDWYYFECTEGLINVTIHMDVYSGDADLYLMGYDCGNPVVLDSSMNFDLESEYISYGPDGPATYAIVVQHWDLAPSTISDYSITIDFDCGVVQPCEPEGNETCDKSTFVSDGFSTTNCVELNYDFLDWYYFECTEDLTNVTIHMDVYSGDADLYLLGYDCDDPVVLDFSGNWDLEPEDISYGPDGPGTYYVVVQHWDGAPSSITNYSITIDYDCEVVQPCDPGDLNGDGCVDENDVIPIGIYWGCTESLPCWDQNAADADCAGFEDGQINENEIINIGIYWGVGC